MTIELAPDDDYAEPVEPVNVTPPITYGPMSTTGNYVPPKWGRETAFVPSRTPFKADSTSRSGCASTTQRV